MDKMMFWEKLIMTTTAGFHKRHTLAPIYISKMLLIEWPEFYKTADLFSDRSNNLLFASRIKYIFYICFNVETI